MDGQYRRPWRRRRPFFSGLVSGAILAAAGFGGYLAFAAPQHRPEFLDTPVAPAVATPAKPAKGDLSTRAGAAVTPPGFATLVRKVKPAVVTVRVRIGPGDRTGAQRSRGLDGLPPGLQERPQGGPGEVLLGLGSGFFVSSDGYIVTNNHVVQDAETVHVTTGTGKTLVAKVIGTDADTDLALIKVDGGPYPYLTLTTTPPAVGDWVLAIGNPFGLGGTVTAGIVSALERDISDNTYDRYIQIDAPVNKGNSGGPAVAMNGEVIGVNSAIYSPNGGSVGIAFDIPAAMVKRVITQLLQHGHVVRGWLGVEVQTLTPDLASALRADVDRGVVVAAVAPNGPAAKAGVQPGSIITAVDGTSVASARDLVRSVAALKPGASATFSVITKGTKRQQQIVLGPKATAATVGTAQ